MSSDFEFNEVYRFVRGSEKELFPQTELALFGNVGVWVDFL